MKTPVELMSSVADREINITEVSGARASMVGLSTILNHRHILQGQI